jgi:hypothetical protein
MVSPNGLNKPTLGIYLLILIINSFLKRYSYLIVRYKTIVITVMKLLVESLALLKKTLIDNAIYIP